MQILTRLKLELNNKPYFTDEELSVFLEENALDPEVEYEANIDKMNLYKTVISVFQALSNDIDHMRRVNTEFITTDQASQHLNKRIKELELLIKELQRIGSVEESPFTLLYSRR